MKKSPFLLTTYTKVILSGWPAIFNVINKYTKVKKQLIRSDLPLLSGEQLEEVFLDQQTSFIKYSIATRAKAILALISVYAQLEEVEEQRKHAIDAMEKLEEFTKTSQETDPKLQEALETAKDCLIDIKATQTELEKKLTFFQNLTEKMDKLLDKQDGEWDKFKNEWASKMIEELEKIGIRLTELEKTEIRRQKTTLELIERMKELGLALPKVLQD